MSNTDNRDTLPSQSKSTSDKIADVGKKLTTVDKAIDVAKKTGVSEKVSDKVGTKF